jgi:integrase
MVLKEHRRISAEHGASTANNVFRHLRSVFNFVAASQEDFPQNPVTVLAQARAWNPEHRRRTLIAAHNLPVWWQVVMEKEGTARDLLRMGLRTGMRRRELTTLRWDDVDLVGRALHSSKTKNGDPFSLPMSGALVDIIFARRDTVGHTEWVSPGIGTTGHLAETKSIVKRVAKRSGVPFAMHDLRRNSGNRIIPATEARGASFLGISRSRTLAWRNNKRAFRRSNTYHRQLEPSSPEVSFGVGRILRSNCFLPS